jgi:prophage regulatory protein
LLDERDIRYPRAVADSVVGISEIARLLGVTPQRAGQITRDHADFPEPVAALAAGRVWEAEAVQAWIAAHPDRRGGRPRKQRS